MKTRKSLQVLDNLQVSSPCKNSWAGMSGSQTSRYCSDCKKHVFDTAALTRKEVARLLSKSDGHCCMMVTRRRDNTVVFDERTRIARAFSKSHMSVMALMTGLLTISIPWKASSDSNFNIHVPSGHSIVKIPSGDEKIRAGMNVDIVLKFENQNTWNSTILVQNSKVATVEGGDVSLLVSEADAKKIARAQQMENSKLSLTHVELQTQPHQTIGLVMTASPTNKTRAGVGKESCMTINDSKAKLLFKKYCLRDGRWTKVEPEAE